MNLKFDLQFFGGTKQNVQRIAKRDPEPEALTNLRNNLICLNKFNRTF